MTKAADKQPIPPQTVTTTPKPRWPKWLFFVIGLVVLSAILSGGFLWYSRQKLSQSPPIAVTPTPAVPSLSPSLAVSTSPAPSTAPDQTSGWKTYNGSYPPFSAVFKYPPEWNVVKTVNQDNKTTTIKTSDYGWLTLVFDLKGLALPCEKTLSENTATVSGMEATIAVTEGISNQNCDNSGTRTYIATIKDRNFKHLLSLSSPASNFTTPESTFNQILSTFRLTGPKTEPTTTPVPATPTPSLSTPPSLPSLPSSPSLSSSPSSGTWPSQVPSGTWIRCTDRSKNCQEFCAHSGKKCVNNCNAFGACIGTTNGYNQSEMEAFNGSQCWNQGTCETEIKSPDSWYNSKFPNLCHPWFNAFCCCE